MDIGNKLGDVDMFLVLIGDELHTLYEYELFLLKEDDVEYEVLMSDCV